MAISATTQSRMSSTVIHSGLVFLVMVATIVLPEFRKILPAEDTGAKSQLLGSQA